MTRRARVRRAERRVGPPMDWWPIITIAAQSVESPDDPWLRDTIEEVTRRPYDHFKAQIEALFQDEGRPDMGTPLHDENHALPPREEGA